MWGCPWSFFFPFSLTLSFLVLPDKSVRPMTNPCLSQWVQLWVVCVFHCFFWFLQQYLSDSFPNLSQSYLDSGKAYLNKDEVMKTINEFRVAIQLHPGNAEAQLNLRYAPAKRNLQTALLFKKSTLNWRVPSPERPLAHKGKKEKRFSLHACLFPAKHLWTFVVLGRQNRSRWRPT